jgi:hypothetical protein
MRLFEITISIKSDSELIFNLLNTHNQLNLQFYKEWIQVEKERLKVQGYFSSFSFSFFPFYFSYFLHSFLNFFSLNQREMKKKCKEHCDKMCLETLKEIKARNIIKRYKKDHISSFYLFFSFFFVLFSAIS